MSCSSSHKVRPSARRADLFAFVVLAVLCGLAIVLLAAVVLVVLAKSWPVFTEVGIVPFLTGSQWMPVDYGMGTSYGIRNFILATVEVSALALAMASLVAIGCSLFLSCIAGPKIRTVMTSLVDLLAGIPSVVYGFIGLVTIVPFLLSTGHPSGTCVIAAAVVLAIMVLPYMVSTMAETMCVSRERYLDVSRILGVDAWYGTYAVVLPDALRKLGPSIMMAFGRAMGETMAVMMVMGNANLVPTPLGKGETIAALITLEMGTAAGGSLHASALFAAGLVLFVIVFIVDGIADVIRRRLSAREGKSGRTPSWRLGIWGGRLAVAWAWISTAFVAFIIVFLFGYVIYEGAPYVSWDFITQSPSGAVLGTEGGVWPAITGSCWFTLTAVVIAAPLAIACAMVRVYWLGDSVAGRVLERIMAVAAGAPSIVCGLFAYAVFVRDLGIGRSVLSGGVALAIMILPFIEVRAERAFRDVPSEYVDAGLALGCSRMHVVRTIALPASAPDLASGVLLGALYAFGATAPLVFCGGVAYAPTPTSLLDPAMALPLHLYLMLAQGTTIPQVYATALVLMVFVLAVNLVVNAVSHLGRNKWHRN
jgi:phosphate transport system permease protein